MDMEQGTSPSKTGEWIMSEIEKAVSDYLLKIKVKFDAAYIRKNSATHGTFPGFFRWSVTFQRFVARGPIVSEDFYFYMGPAHIVKGTKSTPKAPCACEVLYCLIADSAASDIPFEAWSDEYGYDADSRRALRTYEACLEQTKKLARVFHIDERKALADLMADY